MSLYVIGIDPGKNGGIAAFNNGRLVELSAMPATAKEIFNHFLFLGFPGVQRVNETYIFIEKVHSMPRDGSKAAFTFGRGFGWLEAVIAATAFSGPIEVTPQIWMKYFNIKKDKEDSHYNYKKRLKELALKRAPERDKKLINLKTADAYLIGLYGHKYIKNRLARQAEASALDSKEVD